MKSYRRHWKALAALLTVALFLGGFAATASAAPAGMTQAQKDFIATVGAMASEDMKQSDILASLTLAQAILESGWGTSALAVNANALFGIKADSRWSGRVYSKSTLECYDGVNFVREDALFRAYDSWQQSVSDHSAFLLASSRYAAVIGERDYRKACTAIHSAGYATDPGYAQKLVRLIETYDLTSYDAGGAGPGAALGLVSRLLSALRDAGVRCPFR
ncbi:MAG: glycoside hydrolase family 73 protein [Oscillospiraceae bacterium]|jgi:flagellum-specific peptidoglycan hydrolase FlgJ|nr:glycoside hydrolase family 73 protein [Oscillospiraceae bacterium]